MNKVVKPKDLTDGNKLALCRSPRSILYDSPYLDSYSASTSFQFILLSHRIRNQEIHSEELRRHKV